MDQEVLNRNLNAVLQAQADMRKEYGQRMQALEFAVNNLTQQLGLLEQKYNLLLTKRFNGGPTAE